MNFDFSPWVKYFIQNKENLQHIEWNVPYILNSKEYDTIHRSIQQFQVGERSEGKFLIKSAKSYLANSKDDSYLQALIFFIREEQRHANDLAKFMKRQGIPTIRTHWVDRVDKGEKQNADFDCNRIFCLDSSYRVNGICYHW